MKTNKKTESPAARRERLLDTIASQHDWREGKVYSGGGTALSSTDTCQLCGLVRHWNTDPQNGDHGHYRFESGGEPVAIAAVAARGCA